MQNNLLNKIVTIETWVAASSLFLMLALSVFQMLLRNFLDFGYPEIELINRHLLVVCGMMGAVLATSHATHIKIDALAITLSSKQLIRIKPFLQLFSAAVCLVLSYYSVIFCLDEYEYAPANERWLLAFTLTYPVCFFLMSFHFFFGLYQKLTDKLKTR